MKWLEDLRQATGPALVPLRARLGVPDGEAAHDEQKPSSRHQAYLDLYRRMRLIRRFKDVGPVAVPARRDLRDDAPVLGPGGGGDRLREPARGARPRGRDVPRPRACARARRRPAGAARRDARARDRHQRRPRRLDERQLAQGPADGLLGIVGGSIAAATGAALALRRTGGIAVASFGDGTVDPGYFPECLNFCKVLNLPLVFVCENNGYGEYTPFQAVTAGEIRARAEVMEVPTETIDGMSVWTMQETARRAIEHARSGGGPCFVEAITYRFVGHSRGDPGAYRPEGELDTWRQRDPLVVLRARSSGWRIESGHARRDRCGGRRAAERARGERAGRAVPGGAQLQRVQGLTWRAAGRCRSCPTQRRRRRSCTG